MIIGVTGTNGSGKGTVVDYLVTKGFTHYSARDFIVAEIKRRGLPVDRSAMRDVGNSLRKAHGPTYITDHFLGKMGTGEDAIIESVREVPSARKIQEMGGSIVAVTADPRIRYERIQQRASETDKVSFETFMEQDEREFTSTDPAEQNVMGVMAMADYTIQNNGTVEEFRAQVDAALAAIHKAA